MHNNVQLLQKQGPDRPREPRRDTGSSQATEDRRWERGRRPSNATTTHSALSGGRDSSRESLRQLPPHLTTVPKSLPPLYTQQLPHAHPPSSRHSSTREPWRQERSLERSPVITSPSYSSSHFASPITPSAVAPSPQALTAPPADIELVRKAAMHSAAERAKLRRQQDEEERERERERARMKAAVLVEKMEPAEKEETQEHPTTQVGFLLSCGEMVITNSSLTITGDTVRVGLSSAFHGAIPRSTARRASGVIKTSITRPRKWTDCSDNWF
jgi:serine/arginine repetitive matrix protein 2